MQILPWTDQRRAVSWKDCLKNSFSEKILKLFTINIKRPQPCRFFISVGHPQLVQQLPHSDASSPSVVCEWSISVYYVPFAQYDSLKIDHFMTLSCEFHFADRIVFLLWAWGTIPRTCSHKTKAASKFRYESMHQELSAPIRMCSRFRNPKHLGRHMASTHHF